jgi:hypothetical protein
MRLNHARVDSRRVLRVWGCGMRSDTQAAVWVWSEKMLGVAEQLGMVGRSR